MQAAGIAASTSAPVTDYATNYMSDAHAALQQVVQRDGISRKDAIERSILNEAKGRNMQSQFRRDDPAIDPVSKQRTVKLSQPARKDVAPMTTTTPARPSEMTVVEH